MSLRGLWPQSELSELRTIEFPAVQSLFTQGLVAACSGITKDANATKCLLSCGALDGPGSLLAGLVVGASAFGLCIVYGSIGEGIAPDEVQKIGILLGPQWQAR